MSQRIFLFGEAEKGDFRTPILCKNLQHLVDLVGNPPEESLGIYYAIQSLLYGRELLFYRVEEEGFSTDDYLYGLRLLQNSTNELSLQALCMPGVGDSSLIELGSTICQQHKSFLLINEKDLFDYLTCN